MSKYVSNANVVDTSSTFKLRQWATGSIITAQDFLQPERTCKLDRAQRAQQRTTDKLFLLYVESSTDVL